MFCVIYRSTKREQTYLYVEKKDDFSRVPDELMRSFGTPQMAMLLPLDGRKKLVNADLEKVKTRFALNQEYEEIFSSGMQKVYRPK